MIYPFFRRTTCANSSADTGPYAHTNARPNTCARTRPKYIGSSRAVYQEM